MNSLQRYVVAALWLASSFCYTKVFAQAAAPAEAKALAPAAAAATPKTVYDTLKDLSQIDLSVPSSPAFAALGISPSKVQRPGSPRALATSLIRGLDANGKLASGLALDIAPKYLLAPQSIIGGAPYAADNASAGFNRILARTTVSLATTDGASSDVGSKRIGWGVRIGLYDAGDPGLYYDDVINCVLKVPSSGLKGDDDLTITKGPDITKCKPDTRLNLWAKPALYVGLGESRYSKTGSLNDTTGATRAVWATYSIGVMNTKGEGGADSLRGLLQVHADRMLNERAQSTTDPATLVRQDSSSLTIRGTLGRPMWHAFLDVGYKRAKLADAVTDRSKIVGLGFERNLASLLGNTPGNADADTWFQVGMVRQSGIAGGKDVTGVTMSFNFGSAPFLTLP